MPDLIRYALALTIVFGLLGAVVLRYGRGLSLVSRLSTYGNAKESSLLKQVSSVRLTPQHSVHVIEYGETTWLLACSQTGVTLIGEANSKPPAARGPE